MHVTGYISEIFSKLEIFYYYYYIIIAHLRQLPTFPFGLKTIHT